MIVLKWTVGMAMLLGLIGFSAGFFGPIIFTPDANQGPLLGIFITGPAGFVLGGIVGFLIGIVKLSKSSERSTSRGIHQ